MQTRACFRKGVTEIAYELHCQRRLTDGYLMVCWDKIQKCIQNLNEILFFFCFGNAMMCVARQFVNCKTFLVGSAWKLDLEVAIVN